MISSLVAFVIAAAQPVPADPIDTVDPVEVQAEAQVVVEAETPVVEAEAEAEADVDANVEAAAEPEEDIVCRRRLRPAERIGQRHRVVRDCRPRSEWEAMRRR